MDIAALFRSQEKLTAEMEGHSTAADVEAALERARTQIEELSTVAAQLAAVLPEQIGDAVREGVHDHARPLGRQLAEVRGLLNQTIRRLERIEHDLAAERAARIEDLGLLVDLVSEGWRTVDARLDKLEQRTAPAAIEPDGATVYRLAERVGV